MGRKRVREAGEEAKSQLACVRHKHRDMMLTILVLHSNDVFRSGVFDFALGTPLTNLPTYPPMTRDQLKQLEADLLEDG